MTTLSLGLGNIIIMPPYFYNLKERLQAVHYIPLAP